MMNVVLDIVNEPDPAWMLVLIALLCWVGSRMIYTRPDLGRWGYRIAAGSFVLYALYRIEMVAPTTSSNFVGIAVRGLLAAGLALGVSWISLAMGGFIYDLTIARFHKAAQRAKQMRDKRAFDEYWEMEDRRRKAEEQKRAQEKTEAPVVPRPERIRASVEQAKADYQVECEALRNAGLDVDELDMALVQARTKYLRALKKEVE